MRTIIAAIDEVILPSARILLSLGYSRRDAINEAALIFRNVARDADKRARGFERSLSEDEAEMHAFIGAVSADILDGTVSRPSTGNVRAYALSRL